MNWTIGIDTRFNNSRLVYVFTARNGVFRIWGDFPQVLLGPLKQWSRIGENDAQCEWARDRCVVEAKDDGQKVTSTNTADPYQNTHLNMGSTPRLK